jgi:hypothetical protein
MIGRRVLGAPALLVMVLAFVLVVSASVEAEEFVLKRIRLEGAASAAARGRPEAMRGQVQLGGHRYEITLIDYDRDMVYGTVSRPQQSNRLALGDQLALMATIEDGRRVPLAKPRYFFVGKFLWAEDKFYNCEIPADGSPISLTPAQTTLGRLRPAHKRFWMQVISPEVGTFELYAPPPSPDPRESPLDMWVNSIFVKDDGTFALPPGDYHVFRWTFEQVDQAGVKWLYTGYDSDVSRPVTLRADETTEVSFGPPLQAKLTTQGTARAGVPLRFSLALTDQRGGRIIGVTREGKLPGPPGLRITDEAGKEVASGKFEYG